MSKCETVRNIEREAASSILKMTVEQAFRMSDNLNARSAWGLIADWTGWKARITPDILQSFQRLIDTTVSLTTKEA